MSDDVVRYTPEVSSLQTATARLYLTVMETSDKIAKDVHRVNTALDGIAALLSDQEWSPDTLNSIADIVRGTGRDIGDVA